MSGSDPFGHGSRGSNRGDDGIGAPLEQEVEEAGGGEQSAAMTYCLSGLAELAMREGDAEQAIQALGASQHLFADIGAALDPDGAKTWGEVVDFASTELGAERAEELRQRGAELSLDDFAALSF